MSKQNIEDIYPLSPAQQGMLMVLLLSGYRSEVYFEQVVATLEGRLDLAAWQRAWQEVVRRHPALRTQFVWERREQPLQVVRREVELPWQELDWSALPEAEREERLAAFLRDDHARGFDLGKPPLMRIAMIRWEEDAYRLVWSFHHLVFDGWSISLVLSEAINLYSAYRAGRAPNLPAPRPYRSYIGWLQRRDPARAEAFWRQELAGFTDPTPLPLAGLLDGDGASPDGDGWASTQEKRALTPEITAALDGLARRHGLTLNTVIQGAWGLLLSRLTGGSDVVFGAVVSGRPAEVEGIETMAGLFINALPVRVRVDPARELAPWLAELQERQSEQREYEHSVLEQVQAWSEVPRQTPLFESLLVFQNYPVDPLGLGDDTGFTMRDSRLKESTHYPLTMYVTPEDGRLQLRLAYHVQRFGAGAARRLLGWFAALLEGIARTASERIATDRSEVEGPRIGELPLLSAEERAELLAAAAGPIGPAAWPVLRLFQEQAARTPQAPAVIAAQGQLTYAELATRARRLGLHLRRLGVGAESVVGLCVERSLDMVVGMLGVLEAGGAYLPLDPAYPVERLGFMLRDSGARVLLTQDALVDRLPEAVPGLLGVVCLDSDWPMIDRAEESPAPAGGCGVHNPAYVIYTSGSTGQPKGVVVEHASLANYVAAAADEFGIGADDRVLQFASMSFDTSAEEIYPCLTRGATLVLRDGAMASSPDGFAREVERLGITVLDLPTAYWHELVAEMERQGFGMPDSLRLVILGGEQAQAARFATWRARVGDRVRLVNTYGPTEATIVSTHRDLTGEPGFPGEIPIGRPVRNARAYVVARGGWDLAPAGVDGELWIGGAGLARGYLGRPDLTAERFVPNPFHGSDTEGGRPGERLYRTGDLVRLLPDGDLEFRGRVDHQVKIRGFRIELGEVEAALRRLPAVREAVAGIHQEEDGDKRLVAWVETGEGERPTVASLRQGLKGLLPDHMVPTAFVVLDALPLTPSGKLDRRALPAPDAAGQDAGGDFAAPRSPVEEVLAGIWSEVLKVERVGIHDDFFVLGGHSLLVGQVVTRVRQALAVELPLADVFKQPTVARLAELIEQGQLGADLPELPPIVRQPRDGRTFPLSFPQERVWFLDQLSVGGNIAYNFQVAIWFQGPLDIPVLERSLGELIRRHEVLRTSFPAADGLPVQRIHPAEPVSLELVDLSDYPEAEREEMAEMWIDATVRDPFDVSTGPLIRWRLLRLAPDHHALVQVEHHFVHDGWSFGVLLRELKAIYAAYSQGEPSPLPELPVQYADFSVWQRQWLEGEVMERLLGFWRQKLAGHPPALEIPGDRPRPARPKFQGRVEMFLVRPDLYEALRRFGRKEGFTFYMTMLSGFFTLLHRYTGQEDVVIGSSNANRRAKEIEGMIGMVVNTLVLRGDLGPEAGAEPDFRKVLARVRELTLEVYAHQDMPFERLVKDLKIERQIGRNPLFQIMFNFHNASVPDLDFGGGLSAATNVRANRSAKMDMNIIVVPRSEQRLGLAESEIDRHAVLHWEWNTDLYDFQTIERMVGHYQTLLEGVVASPEMPLGELPILTAAEREQLTAWAETGTAYPREATIPGLFEACAEASPGSVAVELGDESLTYADLNRRANRLAHHLRRLGAGPGQLVGLCAERSLDLVPAILGILKSGAGFAPLDPSYPAERLAWMLADTGAKILVGHERLLAALPEGPDGAVRLALDGDGAARIEEESAKNPVPLAGPADVAYVMYTSGSTGRPKGVAVSHRNVVRLVRETNFARFGPEEVFLQLAPVSFDASTLELWGPLLNGGRLAVFPPRQPSLEELGEVIAQHGVTTLWLTAGLFHQMVEGNLEGLRPVRQLLAGGDVLSPAHVRRVLAELPGTTVINGYGPTEGTTFTCCHAMTGESRVEHTVPIGRPISNTRVHVVDGSFRTLPVGLPGELLVGGDGLAVGYLHRPELTAERFVPDPFGAPGGRLYRTGDQARWLADGAVEFFGRRDGQVKIRGYRIETGEIEAALAEHPEVREAAVVAREDAAGDRRLVAYVAAGTGDSVDVVAALRSYLESRLPVYMVPAAWVVLDSLPLTANGKVDRRALPAPEAPRRTERLAPRTSTEVAVAEIWREVLKVESVGVDDDFFALGGHSLAATRVLSRLRQRLGAQLSLANVFECSTLESLAAAVDEAVGAGPAAVEAIPAVPAPAPATEVARDLSDDQLDALLAEMMTDGGVVELPS